jgi:hypothetical protein
MYVFIDIFHCEYLLRKLKKQINSKELNETSRVVGRESTIKNYNIKITFTVWIVCCPPTIKNIKLERVDQGIGLVSRILVGSFELVGITKIGHY